MAEKTLNLNDLKEMVKTITKQSLKESSLKQMFNKHWNTKKKENIARKETDALYAAGENLEGFKVWNKFLDDKTIAWRVFVKMQDPRNTESESELTQQETEYFNRSKYNPQKEIGDREAQYPGFAKAYESALAMGSKNPIDDAFNILKQQGTGPKVGEPEFDPKSGHVIKQRQHGSVRTEPEFDPKSGHVIPGSRKVVGPKFDPKSGHVIDDLDESKKLSESAFKDKLRQAYSSLMGKSPDEDYIEALYKKARPGDEWRDLAGSTRKRHPQGDMSTQEYIKHLTKLAYPEGEPRPSERGKLPMPKENKTKMTHKQLREMIREVLSEEDKVPEEKETPEDEKKELNEKTVTLEQLREMIRDGVLESMDKELTKKLKKRSK